MTTRINRALNIVLAVDSDTAGTVYVYSIPVSREVYNSHFEALSLTHSRLWDKGAEYALTESQRVSYLMLRQVAKEMGQDRANPEGQWPAIQKEFINEIVRLTTVAVPTDAGGYEQMPLATALERKVLDDEDGETITASLVFFTLEVLSRRRAQIQGMWSGATTSLGFTEFLSSLQKPTSADNSGPAASAPMEPQPARLASVPR